VVARAISLGFFLALVGGAGGWAAAEPYPAAVIDRPLVLPGGMIELDDTIGHVSRRELGIQVVSGTFVDLTLRIGLAGRFEIDASTGLGRAVGLGTSYLALAGDRIDLAPRLFVPLSFHRGYDVVSHVELGPGLRARLGARFFAVAGSRTLRLDVRPAVAAHLGLDGGLGVQATSTVAVVASTDLAEVTVAGPIHRTTTALDAWPVALTGVWAAHRRIDAALHLETGSLFDPRSELAALVTIGVRR
jgi:hypothetical protein